MVISQYILFSLGNVKKKWSEQKIFTNNLKECIFNVDLNLMENQL
jgi:hypothetical protein